ncbi:CRAL-TRIO domain-containing protein [Jimgerdemannia flammicorona]|uniref:CRAL-TRIO domain-containing protein n=1 Tax=Jimgerdemannia flammicorona TaxID=994334 RepID=A0A433QTB3_9FUNG|nr:CRAL-TRIO domain-containing protein [Jimgerdemannia flammicorona]
MTASEPQPGQCGNLTDQQVAHLKELWVLMLDLFEQTVGGPEPISTLSPHLGGPRTLSPTSSTSSPPKKENKPILGSMLYKVRPKRNQSTSTLSPPNPASLEDSGEENDISSSTTPTTNPLNEIVAHFSGAQLHETFWNIVGTDNADGILLRFLRARKWDVQKAFHMCCATLKWRIDERVDELVALGEVGIAELLEKEDPGQGAAFLKQLESGKSYLGGPDKGGRPICFINVSLHHKEDQSLETLKKFTVYTMETARLFVDQPIETACIVFNMTDFSLACVDMEYVKFLISCFEAYYPESLGVCLVHHSPWIFSSE